MSEIQTSGNRTQKSLDFGIVWISDVRISVFHCNLDLRLNFSIFLQEYITQEGHKLDITPKPPPAVTNAVSWRTEGVKYRKNEVQ